MAPHRIAIMASGSGTTADAFIRSCIAGKVSAEIVGIISNQKSPGVFEKIDKINNEFNLKIPCICINKKTHPEATDEQVEYGKQTKAEEAAILEVIDSLNVDLVALLGYMKLVGSSIVEKYGWNESYDSIYRTKMINTHPGVLPYTKGLYGIHVQQYALINDVPAGHCIFAVDSKYDDGPIISEHRVEKLTTDTPETLFERVKASEKKYLADDMQKIIENQRELKQNNYNG